MRLLCVDANKINIQHLGRTITCRGDDLEEGKEYTTRAKPFNNKRGVLCYYIDGLGRRLACRFAELEDDKEMMIVEKKKELLTPSLN